MVPITAFAEARVRTARRTAEHCSLCSPATVASILLVLLTAMPVSAAQKTAINEVISALTGATSRRAKRRLADMFLELVDRDSWPEYYEVCRLSPSCPDTDTTAQTAALVGYSPTALHQWGQGESRAEQVQKRA